MIEGWDWSIVESHLSCLKEISGIPSQIHPVIDPNFLTEQTSSRDWYSQLGLGLILTIEHQVPSLLHRILKYKTIIEHVTL